VNGNISCQLHTVSTAGQTMTVLRLGQLPADCSMRIFSQCRNTKPNVLDQLTRSSPILGQRR